LNRIAVAIGSNVGDRAAHLRYAVERLGEFLLNLSVSSNYETDPVGMSEPQGRFLNASDRPGMQFSLRQLFLWQLIAAVGISG